MRTLREAQSREEEMTCCNGAGYSPIYFAPEPPEEEPPVDEADEAEV